MKETNVKTIYKTLCLIKRRLSYTPKHSAAFFLKLFPLIISFVNPIRHGIIIHSQSCKRVVTKISMIICSLALSQNVFAHISHILALQTNNVFSESCSQHQILFVWTPFEAPLAILTARSGPLTLAGLTQNYRDRVINF